MNQKPKILIVEDDEPIRTMYKFKLESAGYDVYVAEDGAQGLSVIQDYTPDLILLDLMMPEMNGDEMLQKVREADWGANIRVIVLTNLNKNEAPHSLRLLKVDRYIVKAHYTPSQVLQIVEEVLSDRKLVNQP